MFPALTVEPKSLFRGACSLLGSWVVAVWGLLESKSTKTLFPLPTGYKKPAKPSCGSQPYSQPLCSELLEFSAFPIQWL